jgi:Uma2 family endonuclease
MSVMKNENYDIMKNFKYQIIVGKIISMAPLANPNHSKISNRINVILSNYFDKINSSDCDVYIDNNYIRLDIIETQKNNPSQ